MNMTVSTKCVFSKSQFLVTLQHEYISCCFALESVPLTVIFLQLRRYPASRRLSGDDKSTAMIALKFHPKWPDKFGTGISDIKVC